MLKRTPLRSLRSQICNLHDGNKFNDTAEQTLSSRVKQLQEHVEAQRKNLNWRPAGNRAAEEFNSKLAALNKSDQNSDYISMMQQPIELNPRKIYKNWQIRKERFMQQFIPERHEILGPDLASAHFVLYRGGAVKFVHAPNDWLRADENNEHNLPTKYDPAYKVYALLCDNMNLYYEGLENLRGLQHLKILSFSNVANFDDWCLDRVSGSLFTKLEHLNISKTQVTFRGLTCLYRLPTLKELVLDDNSSIDFQLACAMLEEHLPDLRIKTTAATA